MLSLSKTFATTLPAAESPALSLRAPSGIQTWDPKVPSPGDLNLNLDLNSELPIETVHINPRASGYEVDDETGYNPPAFQYPIFVDNGAPAGPFWTRQNVAPEELDPKLDYTREIKEPQDNKIPASQLPEFSPVDLMAARLTMLAHGAKLLYREVLARVEIIRDKSPYKEKFDALDENSCVVITGASRGLGAETVRKLAAESRGTIVLVARGQKAMDELVAEIGPHSHARLITITHDLGANRAGGELAEKLVAQGLIPTILINNAGISNNKPLLDASDDELDQEMNVNFKSPRDLIRAIGGKMQRLGKEIHRRPKVIFIGSMACITGFAGNSGYGSSRTAMHGLVRSFQLETGSSYPSMHLITYGQIDTDAANDYKTWYMPRMSTSDAADVLMDTVKQKYSRWLIIPGFANKLTNLVDPWMPIAANIMMMFVTGAFTMVQHREGSDYEPGTHYKKPKDEV